jgi:hypothetical protein
VKPEDGKTAVSFQAKDDLAEVRYRVFHVLLEHNVRFSAVVRGKQRLVEQVRGQKASGPQVLA